MSIRSSKIDAHADVAAMGHGPLETRDVLDGTIPLSEIDRIDMYRLGRKQVLNVCTRFQSHLYRHHI